MTDDEAPASTIADAVRSGVLPGRVWLYSNYNCNLACGYCLTESSPQSERRMLTPELMTAVAEQAAELGFTDLGVTGGEPFLLPWLTPTVVEMAASLPVVVNTNGTLFVGDRLNRLAPLADVDVALQISLDSHLPDRNDEARGPGNFEKVVDAVPRLIELGIEVRIATTTAGPLDDPALDPLKDLVVGMGVTRDHHVIRPIVRRGRADELGLGLQAGAQDIPSELTVTADGAFWGSFGPTVLDGVLDIDLLVTRTVLPLSVPANALLALLLGQPSGPSSSLGIRCA
ncbi:MAG: radical SAM protein [Acidimicrobiales bacterium]